MANRKSANQILLNTASRLPSRSPRLHSAPPRTASELDVSGLVGIPYCRADVMRDPLVACDCWALTRLALSRAAGGGVHLPADPAAALEGEHALGEAVGTAQSADIILINGEDGPHTGVMIDGFRFLHMTRAGSRVDSLAAWERMGRVVRRVRPFTWKRGDTHE